MMMQTGRGSLLTKDCLHGYFYRAQARHEINLQRKFMNGMAAEMMMQTDCGSLLTKGCLHGHFYRAQARQKWHGENSKNEEI